MCFKRIKKQEIGDSLRTCEIDGDKAFFHVWTMAGYAIIEYIDGTVGMVHPDRVKFTDR